MRAITVASVVAIAAAGLAGGCARRGVVVGGGARAVDARLAGSARAAASEGVAGAGAGQGGALTVRVQAAEGTGTMHYAERVAIEHDGAQALVLESDVERGTLAPIVERQVALGPGRWLVLGWSSWGAGMQTDHALVVERAGGALRVTGRLEFTRARGHAGLLVAAAGDGTRVGVAAPAAHVHEGADWSLRVGARALDLAAIRALPYAPLGAAGAGVAAYAPPFGGEVPAGARVAWFTRGDLESAGASAR